jgi:hypothetical protein
MICACHSSELPAHVDAHLNGAWSWLIPGTVGRGILIPFGVDRCAEGRS